MDAHTKNFRVFLNSEAHSAKNELFQRKEELTGFILDVLQTLPEDSLFELHIIREKQEDEGKDIEEEALPSSYDVDLMREQLLLFDRQEEMTNYVETEKILANDAVKQLTQLANCLLRLGKQLLLEKKPLLSLNFKEQQHYSREKLDRIQAQCLKTLLRVAEQRKRAENCCICLSNRSTQVLLPCMHLVLCGGCGDGLSKCPICSRPISEKREVFQ